MISVGGAPRALPVRSHVRPATPGIKGWLNGGVSEKTDPVARNRHSRERRRRARLHGVRLQLGDPVATTTASREAKASGLGRTQ